MKVAIGIPAYNAENYLRQTLDSVLAQTFRDWELVLVDDGSTDKTVCIAQEYAEQDARIRLLQQPNRGPSAARNYSFAQMATDAELIIFLDADDVWEPEALETLVAALGAYPQAIGAHSIARYIDSRGETIRLGQLEAWCRDRRGIKDDRLVTWSPEEPTTFAVLAYRQRIATTGVVLMRRAALEAAGLFDPQTKHSEDWDMWLRLSLQGDIAFVDKVLLSYRQHDSSLSKRPMGMRHGEYFVRRKLVYIAPIDTEQRRILALGYRLSERETYRSKMRYARESLVKLQLAQAAKQFCRAARNYVQAVRGLSPS
jgi:glycosyltransferase involved in cell wall biosynthesis